MAGGAGSDLRVVARPFPFRGLETRMRIPADAGPYVAVTALDEHGRVLGRSAAVAVDMRR